MREGQLSFDDTNYEQELRVWNFKRLLAQQYDVVVTNPPYMGGSGMNGSLAQFVKDNFPDSKSDLFAVFIERCASLTNNHGISAMITQHSWMFLSSYEKLRQKLRTHEILNMVHLGARAFAEIGGEVVQCTAFSMRSGHIANYNGTYVRLVDFDNADQKEIEFLSENHRYIAQADNFSKIPGMPISYWASENLLKAFNEKPLFENVKFAEGITTGDNDRFLRYWHEVEHVSNSRWIPCNKGGSFRKWYGNRDYIIDWNENGEVLRIFPGSSFRNMAYQRREGGTYSNLTSGKLSTRYSPEGTAFESKGTTFFSKDIFTVIGYMNSVVFDVLCGMVCPTLDYKFGIIQNLPFKKTTTDTSTLVKNTISISHLDWDSFETSFDFKRHPLV